MEAGNMAEAPGDGTEGNTQANAAESVEPGTSGPAGAAIDDGGDVAASRDPDAIAREIEQTRAELADTIDAIADRISPKRAAARGAQAVKAQVSSAKDKVTGDGGSASEPASGGLADQHDPVADPGLPIGPIAALAGVLLAIMIIVRRRHSR